MLTCILGPTASGKTSYSLKLARELDAEIISVDSRQIYRGMNIGTAKEACRPDFNKDDYADTWQQSFEIEGIPHYLIDTLLPTDRYTAFDFKEQAQILIRQIQERGKQVILAGGTGLYFEVLLYDYQPNKGVSSDPIIRKNLEDRYKTEGGDVLWKELQQVDPVSAESIHPNNPRYLTRALEYYQTTGQPKSESTMKNREMVYDAKLIGMEWPRDQLYKRINTRIDQQMEACLLEEVKTLHSLYPKTLPSMSSLGYQELGRHLDGELNLEEAIELFKRNTRRYAKRQLTWFRRYDEIEWIPQ